MWPGAFGNAGEAPTSKVGHNIQGCQHLRLSPCTSPGGSLGSAFGGPGPSPWAPTMVSEGRWRPSDRFRVPSDLLLGFLLARFRRRWAFRGGRLKFKKVIDLSESDGSNTHLKL